MPANSIELKYCSTNKQKFNIIKKIVKQFLFREKEIKRIVSNSSATSSPPIKSFPTIKASARPRGFS